MKDGLDFGYMAASALCMAFNSPDLADQQRNNICEALNAGLREVPQSPSDLAPKDFKINSRDFGKLIPIINALKRHFNIDPQTALHSFLDGATLRDIPDIKQLLERYTAACRSSSKVKTATIALLNPAIHFNETITKPDPRLRVSDGGEMDLCFTNRFNAKNPAVTKAAVQALIDQDAGVNAIGTIIRCNTLKHWILYRYKGEDNVYHNYLDCIELLIEQGARVDAEILHFLVNTTYAQPYESKLWELLINNGAKLSATINGTTVIDRAREKGVAIPFAAIELDRRSSATVSTPSL
jgi:hypothetical protein